MFTDRYIFSTDDKNFIIGKYVNQKISIKKIATEYNVGVKVISIRLKRWGIPLRSIRAVNDLKITIIFSDKQIQEIITMYTSGKTLEQVAKIYNCCATTINKILKKNGIKLRVPQVKAKQKIFDKEKNIIIELFQQGMDKIRIGEQVGVSCTTISNLLDKWGICEKVKKQFLTDQERRKRYYHNVLKHDPLHKISSAMSGRIRHALKTAFIKKNGKHWENLVGYTKEELKVHLERLFQSGMTWDNHSIKGWHIDHIKPVSSFNLTSYDCEDFKKCWALSNLQPLWAKDNMHKGNGTKGDPSKLPAYCKR